jgi:hypothetical protein
MPLFDAARLKIRRAEERLKELDAAAMAYFTAPAYRADYRFNADNEEHELVVTDSTEPPAHFVLLTGEIVQALRTALDYAVGDVITRACGSAPAEATLFEFPIFTESTKYERAKRSKLAGASDEDVELIDSVQPFTIATPDTHPLWVLHRLNIEDKHRRLHVVTGAVWSTRISHIGAGGGDAFSVESKWIDNPLRYPLVPGTVLFAYRSKTTISSTLKLEFAPVLLFDAPALVLRWRVLPVLAELIDVTSQVVDGLAGPLDGPSGLTSG